MLCLWLPFTDGTTKNYGLTNMDVVDYGTSVYDQGKLGKCRSFVGNGYLQLSNAFGIESGKDFSCCYWIKEISNNILSKFRVVYQCGNLIIGHYGNKFDIYSITGNTLDLTYVCDTTEWVHCCMTYQSSNNTVTIYINGVKCSTSQPKNLTGLSGTTALIGKRSSETYLFEGYLNDFRIYNTCLSPRQVKEISEGLVCHYPLGEVDGKIGGRNLIKNGKGNVKAGFFKNFPTVTDEYGEFTLKSKKTYKGIILDGFVYECRDYPVGEKYTWSYDIMYTAWNFPTGSNRGELWMGQRYVNAPSGETATGAWRGVTQHNLPVVGQNGCELNKWYHVKQTVTIPQQASSNVGQQGIISFYNSNANVEASFTARLKNVKLEKSSTATPWTPAPEDDASFYDNVIYDTSGYCNNGSVTDSTCPTWSSDTPRYKGSYAFNGNKQYVNCGTSTMIEGQEEITINCWAYMDDWTKFNARLFSCTEGGGYNTEGVNNSIKFALNIYITSDKSKYDYTSTIGGYSGIKLLDMASGWHMITCVYKASVGDAIYLDGKLYEKKTYTSYGIHFNKYSYLFLGGESSGVNCITPYFNGKLSDFRIYVTALSDSDILELYQSSASVDNNGNLMLAGEVIEE
ncbi:LamG-like jellyroll fold domain-containing protein [Coprococcus sp. RTP21281st1_F1_RTP21281_210402]|uniref:LamG domain-containing protein n=1 Tax=Coprococcus sp. RTP21281st1_F1_RTP21281_210402 TaxID=3143208 RepID=UPI00304C8F7C